MDTKFKKEQWITNKVLNSTGYIISIKNNRYEIELTDGSKVFPKIDYIDRNFHLWTIEDAQDGDVLTASIHHWEIRGDIENLPVRVPTIFIYQEVKTDNKNVHAYVSLFDNTSLDMYNKMYYIDEYGIKDIHPATSEQCNLLWQKMREAGYKWDPFAKETIKSSFKLKKTLFSARDRGIIDEIIFALRTLGEEKNDLLY